MLKVVGNRRTLFRRLLVGVINAPLRWVDSIPIGTLSNRFTNDIGTIDDSLAIDFSTFGHQSTSMAVAFLAGGFILPSAVVTTLLFACIYGYTFRNYLLLNRDANRIASTTASPLFASKSIRSIGFQAGSSTADLLVALRFRRSTFRGNDDPRFLERKPIPPSSLQHLRSNLRIVVYQCDSRCEFFSSFDSFEPLLENLSRRFGSTFALKLSQLSVSSRPPYSPSTPIQSALASQASPSLQVKPSSTPSPTSVRRGADWFSISMLSSASLST
jgi:hypothetical protein